MHFPDKSIGYINDGIKRGVILKFIFNATSLYFQEFKNKNSFVRKFVKKWKGFDYYIDFTKRFHGF